MSLNFKYQQEYEKLTSVCPPADYSSQDIDVVFRWVFDTIQDDQNFLPQYHKNPKRFLNKDDLTKCKALGLSFFNNLEGSIERFNELKSDIGETVFSTLGKNVAKGVIKKTDGVNGQLERHGHFTHHSSDNANYKDNFEIIKSL